MIQRLKRKILRIIHPYIKGMNYFIWESYLKRSSSVNIIAGAGATFYGGWFSTDTETLNLMDEADFRKYFSVKKINKFLAEHVFEHLNDSDIIKAVKNIYKYSAADVNVRIAVPDGLHKDKSYIDQVKPGGSGASADDHKQLFTYKTLSEFFENEGFTPYPIEYWDENGKFHSHYKNDEYGYIYRSFINDERNKGGVPRYTSIIIDFKKTDAK